MTEGLCKVDFEPIGKRIDAAKGNTLLDAARAAGIDLVAVCGGAGTCQQCQVQIIDGKTDAPNGIERDVFSSEMLEKGWRLACQTIVHDPIKVHIPPDSMTTPQRLQIEGIEERAVGKPLFRVENIAIQELKSSMAADRLTSPKAERFADATGLDQELDTLLRTNGNSTNGVQGLVRVVYKRDKIINFAAPGESVYGLAVDLGSTKIAAYLVDIETNQIAAKASAMNPQIHYGEDIISRILYCMEHEDGQDLMQRIVVDRLNDLINTMTREIKVKSQQIVEAVVVGNTAMHHLFLRLPVRQLGLSPYTPAMTTSCEVAAKDIGLSISASGMIYLPENIAGYVGGDHVAMMVATGASEEQGTIVALDIGTNTEISLVHDHQILTCSCASGPAFEGAHIKEGMRAAAGAIERVNIDHEEVHYQTIGKVPPIGICGSGILDGIAEMRKNAIMDERGNFDFSHRLVRGSGKTAEFILAPAEKSGAAKDIVITRKDVNEILLAKAAIQSGVEVLLRTAGICAEQIDRFIIAGAFGTYLDVKSAIQIGMFPNLPIERFEQVGNAAGTGARLMMNSDEMRDKGTEFSSNSRYVELTLFPDFQKVYLEALHFPRI